MSAGLLREMTVQDLPRCFDIRTRTRENALTIETLTSVYGLHPDRVPDGMGETLRGWVYETEGEVVGFAMGDAVEAELTVIALLPEAEGRGIGRQLLTEATRWLCATGRQPWLLTAADPSRRAYGFYVAQGWQATGEINERGEERFIYPHR